MFAACTSDRPRPGQNWTSTDSLRAAARLPAMDGSRHSFYRSPPPPIPRDRVSERVSERASSLTSATAAPQQGENEVPRNASDVPTLESEGLRDIFFGESESSNADGEGENSSHSYHTSGAGTQDGGASEHASSAGVSRAFVKDASGYEVGWMFDDESENCVLCDDEFTYLRRRHHCR